MTNDHVFPEDEGTGAPDGDDADAANLAAYHGRDNMADYKEAGLGITYNSGVPDFDLAAGKCYIKESAATTKNTGESRDQGVVFEVEVTSRTGIALADNAVNHVYVDIDLTAGDSVSVVTNTTGSAPSSSSLKIAEIDTSNDTVDETFNQDPDLAGDSVTATSLTTVEALPESITSDYYYAGAFDGADPDARLDNALAAVDADQNVIYLETGVTYSKDRTFADRVELQGSSPGATDGTLLNGVWTFNDISHIESISIEPSNGKLDFQGLGGSAHNISLRNEINVGANRALLSHIRWAGTVTFESGTSDGVILADGNVTVTDNGSNNVL